MLTTDQLFDQRIDGVKSRSHVYKHDANLRERVGPDASGCLTTIHRERYPLLSGTRTSPAQPWVDIVRYPTRKLTELCDVQFLVCPERSNCPFRPTLHDAHFAHS
jgi:hypothetical protein